MYNVALYESLLNDERADSDWSVRDTAYLISPSSSTDESTDHTQRHTLRASSLVGARTNGGRPHTEAHSVDGNFRFRAVSSGPWGVGIIERRLGTIV